MNHTSLLLATAFLGASVLSAAAQSGGNSGAGSYASSPVSASTHCMDANGQPKLKSGATVSSGGAMSNPGGSTNTNSTTGSASTGGAMGSTGGSSAASTAPGAALSKC